jgi:glycosyltransferase involved in cell wall biosynthesis
VAFPSCTIFIPAYLAEHTIEAVIERIPKELWDSICAVLVINDGSPDDTSGAVRRIAERYPKVALHEQAVNQGYGAAVRRGLKLALETPAQYVVCLHADGQYPPEKLPEFLPYMRSGASTSAGLATQARDRPRRRQDRYKVLAGVTWLENRPSA